MTGAIVQGERRIPPELVQEIRARLRVSEVIGRVVTLKRAGREFAGLCPFHTEKTPSFTVNDGKGFYHCFGCGAHGDVIGFTMRRHGLGFAEAVRALAAECGIDPTAKRIDWKPAPARPAAALQNQDDYEREAARRIWRSGRRADGTPVESYLRSRGIDPARLPGGVIPATLRFVPALEHKPSKQKLPAMVACIAGRAGEFIGVHRTYLAPDGGGKADVKSAKMVRGGVTGGSIHLTPAAPDMAIGEGIETMLSVLQATGGAVACWSVVSLGNLAGGGDSVAQARAPLHPTRRDDRDRRVRLPTTVPDLDRPGFLPPSIVRRLWQCEDADERDPAAADALKERAANRFLRLGLDLRRMRASAGGDFNDMLRGAA